MFFFLPSYTKAEKPRISEAYFGLNIPKILSIGPVKYLKPRCVLLFLISPFRQKLPMFQKPVFFCRHNAGNTNQCNRSEVFQVICPPTPSGVYDWHRFRLLPRLGLPLLWR